MGGIVLLDPESTAVQRVIVLQYNPETLTRSLQPQAIGAESGDRLEVLRLSSSRPSRRSSTRSAATCRPTSTWR